jgi:hypothetical protein
MIVCLDAVPVVITRSIITITTVMMSHYINTSILFSRSLFQFFLTAFSV